MADAQQQQQWAQKEYAALAAQFHPRPPIWHNVCRAFLVGGGISLLGQGLITMFQALGLDITGAMTRTSLALLAIGALLTGLGVYDEVGRFGGAGAAIPITGFANSIVAPAMEYRSEGLVFGLSAKLFSIAGPVITFGILSAVVAATLRWAIAGS